MTFHFRWPIRCKLIAEVPSYFWTSTSRLRLAEGPQATTTHPYFAQLAVFENGRLLNVYSKLALGMPHRVADIMAELRGLATDFALCHGMNASCFPLCLYTRWLF
jgi:hypothetical protein